jgi:hypothetical protein
MNNSQSRRIGPRMAAARQIVQWRGGAMPSMLALAESVGPHGSIRYGYAIVHRAIRAGLLAIDPRHPLRAPSGHGAVVLPPTEAASDGS